MTHRVGYFVGSLASDSINRKLAAALVRLAPSNMEFIEIPIRDLPLYSRDYDADFPAEAQALKEAITSVDALLFVTPEYNRGIPGALKNAIDWASRPWGKNALSRRPSASSAHRPESSAPWSHSTPSSRPQFLQRASDERARGVYPVHARSYHRRRRGHQCKYRGLPPQLHD